MFYHFSQNNSGGSFHVSHRDGISHHVIVEGQNLEDITERAEQIGLYWDGCSEGHDCSCCGDRWSRPWSDADEVPCIYGQNVTEGVYVNDYKAIDKGPEGYIHYMDGRVVPVKVKKPVKKSKRDSLLIDRR